MTSEAYVWIHLPDRLAPIVCGRLLAQPDGAYAFIYGRSYRDRDEAIALAPEGMPLGPGVFMGRRAGSLPGPVRDAGPDAWGRFVAEYRHGRALDELGLVLQSQGERTGALAFSDSPTELREDESPRVALADLEAAARDVQDGKRLPQPLLDALLHGTSIGGARPKATLSIADRHWIAKFSSTSDQYRVVRWEAASLSLAQSAAIRVPAHRLEQVNGRDLLLVERFDRCGSGSDLRRRLMLSALTLLDLDDTEAALASYPDLSEVLLRHARDAAADRTELFRRMVFNILIGNEDDHARNHACFWDGQRLALTPAYDLLPQRRAGIEGRQAMVVGRLGAGGRESSLANALSDASRFGLNAEEATAIAEDVLRTVDEQWEQRFHEAGVPRHEIDSLRATSVLSPVATQLDRPSR